MSTFQVTAVRTEKPAGSAHEHISHVQINGTSIIRRETVVRDLRDPNGDRYFTSVRGARANVIVVSCPVCSFRDYIKTERDYTTADNLLSLPRC